MHRASTRVGLGLLVPSLLAAVRSGVCMCMRRCRCCPAQTACMPSHRSGWHRFRLAGGTGMCTLACTMMLVYCLYSCVLAPGTRMPVLLLLHWQHARLYCLATEASTVTDCVSGALVPYGVYYTMLGRLLGIVFARVLCRTGLGRLGRVCVTVCIDRGAGHLPGCRIADSVCLNIRRCGCVFMVNSVLCLSWALLLGLRPAAQLPVQYYHIGVCMSVILCIALLRSHCGSMLQLCASRWVPGCGGCASACISMQPKGRWHSPAVQRLAPASVSSALAMLAALKAGLTGCAVAR